MIIDIAFNAAVKSEHHYRLKYVTPERFLISFILIFVKYFYVFNFLILYVNFLCIE